MNPTLTRAALVTSKEDDFIDEADKLAFRCGVKMKDLGKTCMWIDWLDECDLYFQRASLVGYWRDRLEEATAAEQTAALTAEGREAYKRELDETARLTQKAMYAAHCMSIINWEALCEDEDYSADALFYWKKELQRFQKLAEKRSIPKPVKKTVIVDE